MERPVADLRKSPHGASHAVFTPVQHIIRHLALLGALQMGAFAQPIVLSPQSVNTEIKAPSTQIRDSRVLGSAMAVDVEGTCKYSTDGKKFHSVKQGAELPEHAILRTASGTVDLFVRRMGTAIRLQPDTEVVLDRVKGTKENLPEITTTIGVRKGTMLTVVYSSIPGSKLNVKNAAGQTLKGEFVGGRFNVSADSIQPAGAQKLAFESKGDANAKMAALIKQQIELDEVQGLAETSENTNPGLEQ